MTDDAIAPPRHHRTSWALLITGFVAGLAATFALSGVLVLAVFILSGGPLADEWICSKGEFPATAEPGGGSQCIAYGEALPPGWTADPDGNQRMDYGS